MRPAQPDSMRSETGRSNSYRPIFAIGIVCAVLLWTGVVVGLMVTDVWDESRALVLFQDHGLVELLSSNWKQTETGGVVLFRPLPMLVFSGIASLVDDPGTTWRLLRGLNAVTLLTGGWFLLGVVRRQLGVDHLRDLLLAVAFLFSGSALITASWFANGFDAMALVFIAVGLHQLAEERGWVAGMSFGMALFCKEVAVLVLPFLLIMAWTKTFERKNTIRALLIATAALVFFLVLRSTVVVPGSEGDLRHFSMDGILEAIVRLPVTFWWQMADVPLRWLGVLVVLLSLTVMRSKRAAVGLAGLYIATALLYGPILALGPSPLLSPDNFIGRIYLVPAALALILVALHGRRGAVLLLLVPIVWGAGVTATRHFQFQRAYLGVYEKAASVKKPPLHVHCRFYERPFEYAARDVVFGRFPNARWELKSDGSFVRKDRPAPKGGSDNAARRGPARSRGSR